MPIPVTMSSEPLVYDTLPALKVRFYSEKCKGGNIYTYSRFYFLHNTLALNLCAFEEQPDPASRIEFAISGKDRHFLLLRLTPTLSDCSLFSAGTRRALPSPAPSFFSGNDEQGWYWGASLSLDSASLALAGVRIEPGAKFQAATFKTRADEENFGASFEGFTPSYPYAVSSFTSFVAVDY